jgi:hypothetical protein
MSVQACNVIEWKGPPDPGNEDPPAGQDQGASESKALGKCEPTSTPPGPETQAPVCEFCGEAFERRAGGGSRQRFCSTRCRQDHHNGKTPDDSGSSTSPTPVPPPHAPPPADDWSDTKEHGFCWTDDDTVIRKQSAIAVYINPYNEVIIRQHDWPDDDSFILVKPEYLPLLIRRLQQIMEMANDR